MHLRKGMHLILSCFQSCCIATNVLEFQQVFNLYDGPTNIIKHKNGKFESNKQKHCFCFTTQKQPEYRIFKGIILIRIT